MLMSIPSPTTDAKIGELFHGDATSESVPRAVASEAFEKDLLTGPRSLSLAVLTAGLDRMIRRLVAGGIRNA